MKVTLAHTRRGRGRPPVAAPKTTRELSWTVPQASPLRLIQLLAQTAATCRWSSKGAKVERTAPRRGDRGRPDPPAGDFRLALREHPAGAPAANGSPAWARDRPRGA